MGSTRVPTVDPTPLIFVSSRVAWVQVPYTPHRASPSCKPCLQYSYCRFARHVSLCRWLGSTGMLTAMMHPFRKSPPGDPNSTLFLVDRSGIHPVERTEKSDKNQITQAKSPPHILAGPATSIHNRTRLPRLPRVRWGISIKIRCKVRTRRRPLAV